MIELKSISPFILRTVLSVLIVIGTLHRYLEHNYKLRIIGGGRCLLTITVVSNENMFLGMDLSTLEGKFC